MAYVALALLLALVAPQAAGQEGTVSGTLTLNGASFVLAHVYATVEPGFFDKKTEDVHVLLSDVALPDDARGDRFALIKLARTGHAHMVEVVIDATGSPIGGSIFAKDFDGVVSAAGMHRFAREKMARDAVGGRLNTEAAKSFMGVTWEYDARFSAPIPRPPTPTQKAAQLHTPPALGASAYLAALRRGDLPGFVGTLAADAAADYRGAEAGGRLAALRADVPPDSRVVALNPQADGTVLASVEGHAQGMVIGYTLRMIPVGADWKVGK
ncbi:MAG: hypothetical protein ABI652_01670 [Acidobacteriota bacterium]